ncbi:VanZ family protein [Gynuella sp.]|uniref:VanZ family protein n=1 Tax=Gynuella sp. TaxID=2969146 RepID=UPI003D0CDC81
MQKIIILITLLFVLFIARIIFLADTGAESIFFDLVKATPYGDKVGHFCLFGLLTLLLNWATRFRQLGCYRWRPYLGSMLVVVFVVLEELSQGFFPTRTLDITDLLADAVGITVFSIISFWLQRIQQRSRAC